MQVIKLVTFHANVATKKFFSVNRIREMVTFDLCKQIEKEVFFLLLQAREREKILSPYKESTPCS